MTSNYKIGESRRSVLGEFLVGLGVLAAPKLAYAQNPQEKTLSTVEINKVFDGLKQFYNNKYKNYAEERAKDAVSALENTLSQLRKQQDNAEYVKALEWRFGYERDQAQIMQEEIKTIGTLIERVAGKSQIQDVFEAYANSYEQRYKKLDEAQERLEELIGQSEKRQPTALVKVEDNPYYSSIAPKYEKEKAKKNLEDLSKLAEQPNSTLKELTFARVLRDLHNLSRLRRENDEEIFQYFFENARFLYSTYADKSDIETIMGLRRAHYQKMVDYQEAKMSKAKAELGAIEKEIIDLTKTLQKDKKK